MCVQGRCPCPQFSARVLTEIIDGNLPQIYLGESHRLAFDRWFGCVIDGVNENAHPLRASAVRIDSTSGLTSRLDFDAVLACFDGIVRVLAPYHEVGMSVELTVYDQSSGVLGEARREHPTGHPT